MMKHREMLLCVLLLSACTSVSDRPIDSLSEIVEPGPIESGLTTMAIGGVEIATAALLFGFATTLPDDRNRTVGLTSILCFGLGISSVVHGLVQTIAGVWIWVTEPDPSAAETDSKPTSSSVMRFGGNVLNDGASLSVGLTF